MIKYAEGPLAYNIKLLNDRTIEKTVQGSDSNTTDFMEAIVNHFINHPDPRVVPLYSFKKVKKFLWRKNSYSYSMMRLGVLSPAEKELIDFVGDLYDSYGAGACLLETYYPASKEYPKLFDFLKTIVEEGRYSDIHSGNILMDPEGNYRLIDLEGFLRTPLELSDNDWITR